MAVTRRQFLHRLLVLSATALLPPLARAGSAQAIRLAAAWDDGAGRHFLGIVAASASLQPRYRVLRQIELPTRAHGLQVDAQGRILAVARRPGEWLLRWSPQDNDTQWLWLDAERRFTGHALIDSAGQHLFTVEADRANGDGYLASRALTTLELQTLWPTHGVDPHELLQDADGSLLIANGGVPTQAETGRQKRQLEQMDSSLVRLDAAGKLLAQWRLNDSRLSLRHLARAVDGSIGIALQAEHDEPETRQQAPLLAMLNADGLHLPPDQPHLHGYAGSIVAHGDGFALSCPRAGQIVLFDRHGRHVASRSQSEVCALVSVGGRLFGGGAEAGRRFDNHWLALIG